MFDSEKYLKAVTEPWRCQIFKILFQKLQRTVPSDIIIWRIKCVSVCPFLAGIPVEAKWSSSEMQYRTCRTCAGLLTRQGVPPSNRLYWGPTHTLLQASDIFEKSCSHQINPRGTDLQLIEIRANSNTNLYYTIFLYYIQKKSLREREKEKTQNRVLCCAVLVHITFSEMLMLLWICEIEKTNSFPFRHWFKTAAAWSQ